MGSESPWLRLSGRNVQFVVAVLLLRLIETRDVIRETSLLLIELVPQADSAGDAEGPKVRL